MGVKKGKTILFCSTISVQAIVFCPTPFVLFSFGPVVLVISIFIADSQSQKLRQARREAKRPDPVVVVPREA